MTTAEALEFLQDSRFRDHMKVSRDVTAFMFRLSQHDVVRHLKAVASSPSGWHRLRARLQVLVAVPTPTETDCEEDIGVAALLWILRCEHVDDLIWKIHRGPIWYWAKKIVDYFKRKEKS